jgi:hypothetical protein
MDYIDIILRGYYNENDKQFLSKYFIRECKKVQKENYSFDEFFNGLTNGINILKQEYENRFNKRLNELYLLLDGAENKTLTYQKLKTNSIEQEYKKTIDYCESEIEKIHFEQFPLNLLHFTNDKYRGNLYYNEIEFINNEITNALKEINQPQLTKTQKKTTLTNDAYYSILEKCTIEAFEYLKLKDLYPKDGTKAIWDISTFTITKGDGLPTERDNELFKTEYIKDNMRVTFLMAIERYSEKFQKKYSITRSVFYKKCYQSILTKFSESPLWEKPDYGIDINKPCELTFIWNMRNDIEARSIEPKATIKQPQTLDLSDTSTNKKTSFKNKFDNVTESKVIEHFTKNLVETKYISETNLFNFLNLAFDKMEVPQQKISFEHLRTQQKIIKVFYEYYKVTAGKPYGKQEKYIKLLCNYFNGFEYDKIKTNFAK